jgi:hypothetical protein
MDTAGTAAPFQWSGATAAASVVCFLVAVLANAAGLYTFNPRAVQVDKSASWFQA